MFGTHRSRLTAHNASAGGGKGGTVRMDLNGRNVFVKPGSGTPARALFAEWLLQRYGGAGTPQSTVTLRGEPQYRSLQAMILPIFRGPLTGGEPFDEATRVQRLAMFTDAPFFIIMEPARGTEMAELHDPRSGVDHLDALHQCLNNPQFLESTGRVMAIDTLLGNADRFEQGNTGNAFIQAASIFVIDNDTLLPSFESNRNYNITMASKTGHVASTDDWVTDLINGTHVTPTGGSDIYEAAVMSNLKALAARETFSESLFKSLMKHFTDTQLARDITTPAHMGRVEAIKVHLQTPQVREHIERGFREGLRAVLHRQFDFEQLKITFRSMAQQYGGRDNNIQNGLFDLDALRVRAKYLKHYLEHADHQQAIAAAKAFARGREIQPRKYLPSLEARATRYSRTLPGLGRGNAQIRSEMHDLIANIRKAAIRNDLAQAQPVKDQIKKIAPTPQSVAGVSDHECKVLINGMAYLTLLGIEKREEKFRRTVFGCGHVPMAARRAVIRAVTENARSAVSDAKAYIRLCKLVNQSGGDDIARRLTEATQSLDQVINGLAVQLAAADMVAT